MPALFRPWTNFAIRAVLLGIAGSVIGIPTVLCIIMRTPYVTGQEFPVNQPVEFDHRHHVGDDGIDCRYCHTTVDKSPYAGLPTTETCMNCHNQIWNNSPLLEPVRQSYFTGKPIPWRRVHDLPDFVYFNHSIHVNKGIGCVSCHGRVDRMAAVYQVQSLQMGWCLDCHRNPYPNLRPRDKITDLEWQPSPEDAKVLADSYHTRSLTSCTTCHR